LGPEKQPYKMQIFINSLWRKPPSPEMPSFKHSLKELNRPYLESHANFVFFQSGKDINELNKAFADRGIIIGRPFPPLNDWCRISTGTPEEVALFNKHLKEILA